MEMPIQGLLLRKRMKNHGKPKKTVLYKESRGEIVPKWRKNKKNSGNSKKTPKNFGDSKKSRTFAIAYENKAQCKSK